MKKSPKDFARQWLQSKGWFVRKTAGLPAGTDLGIDWQRAGLPPARLVLDVGAHCGETCRSLLQLFPETHIHAFEPVRENFNRLAEATRNEPNVHCHPLALGSDPGSCEILLQPDSQTHSLRHQCPDGGQAGVRSERIEVSTLDEFALREHLGTIDLLKIDTEGFELEVLRGGKKLLAEGRVRAILLEASLDPDDRIHTPLVEAIKELAPHRFHLASLSEQVAWSGPFRLAYFNAFFVRDSKP